MREIPNGYQSVNTEQQQRNTENFISCQHQQRNPVRICVEASIRKIKICGVHIRVSMENLHRITILIMQENNMHNGACTRQGICVGHIRVKSNTSTKYIDQCTMANQLQNMYRHICITKYLHKIHYAKPKRNMYRHICITNCLNKIQLCKIRGTKQKHACQTQNQTLKRQSKLVFRSHNQAIIT